LLARDLTFDEWAMKETGAVFGIHEVDVSRRHIKAMLRIGSELNR
jgi:DNA-directed RNA polymerase specialized sigma subunit